jgi:hypothetical protein
VKAAPEVHDSSGGALYLYYKFNLQIKPCQEKSKKNLRFSHFFIKFSENQIMTTITGISVSELIQKTGKSRSAIESWISRNGVKPLNPELLYPPDTLERIKKAKRGRPKNPDK